MTSFTLLARPILSSLRAFQQAWVRCSSSSTPEFIRPPGPVRSWTKDEYNAYMRWRYATHPDYRERKIKAVRLYYSNPGIRVAILKKFRDRYANDPDHRQAKLLRDKERYANDPVHRQARLLDAKERYDNDPNYRQARLLYFKERYDNDPDYRQAKLSRSKERYANDADYRQAQLQWKRERYAKDPEYQEAAKQRARESYWRTKHGVPDDQQEPQNSSDPRDKSK